MDLYSTAVEADFASFFIVCTDSHIIRLSFQNDKSPDGKTERLLRQAGGKYAFRGENELCRQAARELRVYLEGRLREFTVPFKAIGTPFEQRVWEATRKIPYGKTASYGQIAELAGTRGIRAVGNALANNPVAVFVPCHRIIRSDRTLGGYCGSATASPVKMALLRIEGSLGTVRL